MTCQYVGCCREDDLVGRMALMGKTVLFYCENHDPLSDETDADPDLWTEAW